jgi:HK97 family phage major capsid protein
MWTLEELRAAREAGTITVEQLRALRDLLGAELRTLHTTIGDGEPTDAQRSTWETLDAEVEAVPALLETAERAEREAAEREQRAARFADFRRSGGGPQFTPNRGATFDGDVITMRDAEVRTRAQRVLDNTRDEGQAHLTDDQRSYVQMLLRQHNKDLNGALIARSMLLTENEHYRSAWMKLISRATPVLTPEESRAYLAYEEFRAMNIGTDASGGFGVPVLIDPTIILTGQGTPNDILDLARVEVITTDTWRGVSSAGMRWKFRAEAAAATDGSPTLAQPTVVAHRVDGYIPYSFEVGMDYPGFAGEMARLLEEGYRETLAEHFTTGTGTDQPFGIVTALDANTNSEVATATAGTIAAADIYGLWAALPQRFRRGRFANPNQVAWMSDTTVMNAIRQLGTVDPNFTVGLDAEGIGRMFNRRYFENDYMANAVSGTTAANLLIVGDWKNYVVAQRAGMAVETVQHVIDTTTGTPTGQRAWFAWARVGADSINDLAFRMLQNKTS